MATPFHSGEMAVQARAGVQTLAGQVGRMIQPGIPAVAQQFLSHQTMLIVGASDPSDRIWASLLRGPAGFLTVVDDTNLRVQAVPVHGDPLDGHLSRGSHVGLLAIEFETRRRMRINGRVTDNRDGHWSVQIEEAYSNCPKYIRTRGPMIQGAGPHSREMHSADGISEAQQRWLARADTFFIASAHPQGGADASHRGGKPGFVQVLDAHALQWPDYAGNNLFQTLGNLSVNPGAGLLFVDFDRGGTLQLTGHAELLWETGQGSTVPETGRSIRFHIQRVVELR